MRFYTDLIEVQSFLLNQLSTQLGVRVCPCTKQVAGAICLRLYISVLDARWALTGYKGAFGAFYGNRLFIEVLIDVNEVLRLSL